MSSSAPGYRAPLVFTKPPHLLIVEARFYDDIVDQLVVGAASVLEDYQATFDRVSVPGALEVPAAIAIAHRAGANGKLPRAYDGYVVLGCVIRGATSHYDTVANESARGIMDLGVQHGLAIGNGILTTENRIQAIERADPERMDKGGDTAYAALALIALRATFKL